MVGGRVLCEVSGAMMGYQGFSKMGGNAAQSRLWGSKRVPPTARGGAGARMGPTEPLVSG